MSYQSKRVINWRRHTKERLIDGFGGECCCCGYDKYYGSLSFHHRKKKKKEISISRMLANNICSWEKIIKEIKKCVLVCSNCHGEIHGGIRKLPKNIKKFKSNYSPPKMESTGKCAICRKDVYKNAICCSRSCAALRAKKRATKHIKDFQLIRYIKKGYSYNRISNKFRVSNAAILKRCRKIGIESKFAFK